MTVVTEDDRFALQERRARAGSRPVRSILAGAAQALVETVLTWQERARQRRHLNGLDDRLLKDIGLSRSDVSQELDKPFWRG